MKRAHVVFIIAVVAMICIVVILRMQPKPLTPCEVMKTDNTMLMHKMIVANPELLTMRNKRRGHTLLHIAANNGQSKIVTQLLHDGANPICCDNQEATPLMYAIQRNHLDIVKILMNNGVKITEPCARCKNDPAYPLMVASGIGNKDIVAYLLTNGAAVNEGNRVKQRCPLQQAIINCHLGKRPDGTIYDEKSCKEIAQLLLNHGADPNIKDDRNETPLYYAIANKHKLLVELLLSRGAYINIKDKYGDTPLTYDLRLNKKDGIYYDLLAYQRLHPGHP